MCLYIYVSCKQLDKNIELYPIGNVYTSSLNYDPYIQAKIHWKI